VVAANTDAYASTTVANNLGLTLDKAKDYVDWLIGQCRARGLTLGLSKDVDKSRALFKNNGAVWAADDTVAFVLDWKCYKEGTDPATSKYYCDAYSAFKNSEWGDLHWGRLLGLGW
jgi:hypothetical protein